GLMADLRNNGRRKWFRKLSATVPPRRLFRLRFLSSWSLSSTTMMLKPKPELQVGWPAANNLNSSATVYRYKQTTCSSASKRTRKTFTDDALSWRTMLCVGATETQRSIARLSSPAKATFSDV